MNSNNTIVNTIFNSWKQTINKTLYFCQHTVKSKPHSLARSFRDEPSRKSPIDEMLCNWKNNVAGRSQDLSNLVKGLLVCFLK